MDGIAIAVVDIGEGEMMQEGEGGMVAMDNIRPALIPCLRSRRESTEEREIRS